MKFWPIFLSSTILTVANIHAKETNQCANGGGVCTNKTTSCKELQFDCKDDSEVCCQQQRVNKDVKRSCKGSLKCKKKGGKCIKTSETCSDVTNKRLCKGKQCTCCFPGCKCGEANTVRIIGGEEVSPRNKYPWIVGIKAPYRKSGYGCGGAIINSMYILTAAHCLYLDGKIIKAKQLQIGVGDHLQLSTDDDIDGVTRLVKVDSVIIHPGYDDDGWDFGEEGDDIALVKLKKELDLAADDEIKAICLPKNNRNSYEGYDGTIAGWGVQDFDEEPFTPDELLEVTLPIWDLDCKKYDPKIINKKKICAGFKRGGKNACVGDSGMSLMVYEDGVYTSVGVASFTYGECAGRNDPSVYIRVSRYLKWIAANTKDASYCY